MKKEGAFISEVMRYDTLQALNQIKRLLLRGTRKNLERLKEWEERVQRSLDFYKLLNKGKVHVANHVESVDSVLVARSKARYILRDFVLKKEAETYRLESNEQIYNLTEEKKLLKEKLRKIQESKEETVEELEARIDELISDQDKLKQELLESDHRLKSLEQDSTLDNENFKRSQRDSDKLIKELKEQFLALIVPDWN